MIIHRIGASALLGLGAFVFAGCSASDEASVGATSQALAQGTTQMGIEPKVLQTEAEEQQASQMMEEQQTSPSGARALFSIARLVHAAPDVPTVDIYLRGLPVPLIRNVQYTETTKYLLLPRGEHTLQLRASPSRAQDKILFEHSFTIKESQRITAVAAGLAMSQKEDEKLRVLPLVEKFQRAEAGKVQVRIVHASPDAPTVGLDVGNDNPENPEITQLERYKDTGEAGVALPREELQIGIAAQGKAVTAFTTPQVSERRGLIVIATGMLEKRPRESMAFGLLAVGSRGTLGFVKQNPFVYALHASPDAPAIDIAKAEKKLVTGLEFGQIAKAIQVPPGSYELTFSGEMQQQGQGQGQGQTQQQGQGQGQQQQGRREIKALLPRLEAGQQYLGIATGFFAPSRGEARFRLLSVREALDLSSKSEVRLQAIHAAPDAPAVDLGLVNQGALTTRVVQNLAYLESTESSGLMLSEGTLPLGIAQTGQTSPVASFTLNLPAGTRAIAVAAGSLDAQRGKPFQLLVVDTNAKQWTVSSVAPSMPAQPQP